MRQIRTGVFETNSSSVHSICIANDMPDMDKWRGTVLRVKGDDYGWSMEELADPESRMSYMYTAFMSQFTFEEVQNRLTEVFREYDIELDFEEPRYRHSKYSGIDYYDCNIDHAYELADFIQATWNDSSTMLSFVFGEKSFVHTGDDNTYWDEYPEHWYDEAEGTTKYEKGN